MKKKILIIISVIIIILTILMSLIPRKQIPTAKTQLNYPIATIDQTNLTTTFSQLLNKSQQNQVKIKTNPEFKTQANWTSDQKLQITPQEKLQPNTNYTVAILYKNKSLDSFNFTTSSYSIQELQQKMQLQTQEDLKSGQVINKLHQQYPWYSKLPIETNEYRIIYDFDKNSFRIRLLTQSSETIKQAALNQLKTLGVDLDQFTYYFLEPQSSFQNLID